MLPGVSLGVSETTHPEESSTSPGRVTDGLQTCSEMKPWGVESAFSAAR